MVQATYRGLAARGIVADASMTDARRKMAYLPAGGEPLHNPVGAAPGVLLRLDPTILVALPGVPEEMKGIFTTSLAPALRERLGQAAFVERGYTVDCGDESQIAPIVDEVASHYPAIYVKSRARAYGEGVRLLITLSLSGPDRVEVEVALDAAEDELEARLAEESIAILNRHI
jgi:molybdopterin-biosynthesis enzyme MoeA-like protein